MSHYHHYILNLLLIKIHHLSLNLILLISIIIVHHQSILVISWNTYNNKIIGISILNLNIYSQNSPKNYSINYQMKIHHFVLFQKFKYSYYIYLQDPNIRSITSIFACTFRENIYVKFNKALNVAFYTASVETDPKSFPLISLESEI